MPDRLDRGHPQARQSLCGVTFHGVLVQQSAAQLLAAEKHVLHDVQVVGQREVLVHGLDPQPRRVARGADVDRVTLPQELAVVGLVDAGNALGQHRLAGAVVAAQRGDLAGREVEVDVVQGLDGAEVLVEVLDS